MEESGGGNDEMDGYDASPNESRRNNIESDSHVIDRINHVPQVTLATST